MTTGRTAAQEIPDPPRRGGISNKDGHLRRLRRIEGQERGLQGMVADEQRCIDILTQVSAMTSALQAVALGLLGDPLSHCDLDAAAAGGAEADAKLRRASDAIARVVRSWISADHRLSLRLSCRRGRGRRINRRASPRDAA